MAAKHLHVPTGSDFVDVRASTGVRVNYDHVEAAERIDPQESIDGEMQAWLLNLLRLAFPSDDQRSATKSFLIQMTAIACEATFDRELADADLDVIESSLEHAVDSFYDLHRAGGEQQVANAARAIVALFE